MPLLNITRRRRASAVAGVATQVVDGTLTLGDPTVVEIDPTVFTAPGTYTIFTYGTLSPTTAVADGYLEADLTGTSFNNATFADTGGAITVTLS